MRILLLRKVNPTAGTGFSLIEVLVATAILAIFVVVLVSALGTASRALIVNDSRQTAKNIAESQMEFIKRAPYSFAYSPPAPAESNFSSSISVTTLPGKGSNIQKITISVMFSGDAAYTLEGYKVN